MLVEPSDITLEFQLHVPQFSGFTNFNFCMVPGPSFKFS